ncbi:MAG: glycogen debranching protein GlgX [Eubacteriales bacterium]|nr:glycogen debranching protein GlgX [Eubacteriales bacterium]
MCLTEQATYPVREISGFKTRLGHCQQNGAFEILGGVNFTIHSQNATYVELVLFKPHKEEPFAVLPFPEEYRIGNVYSMIVFGLNIAEFEYAYRMDGPYDPKKGLLFDRKNLLLDPYARAVAGQSDWGTKPLTGFEYRARVATRGFDWHGVRQPQIPMNDLIIYETHVRGFTRHDSSGVLNPGTFDGLMEKIPYLKELGVNAVELMPIFEFDEMHDMRVHEGTLLLDYWGYNPVAFFAPNTAYSSRKEFTNVGDELRRLIRQLHQNNMEVILDVVFNHTAEGNENGSIFSFKGVDNIYYLLAPDGSYYNFSGCGNTVNCNHPIVHQLIVECLRHWVVEYHVDGFRFDLASILGRNEDGTPMNRPPLLESLAFDPILAGVKLIAEAWDAGGLYQVGSFPSRENRWSEWNGKYRDDMRCFLKGDQGMATLATYRILGSPDLYRPEVRGECASVNFLTCHDGFTLADLYSYNEKHNEANGWDNTDGENNNNSWNCGVEGQTDDIYVNNLRCRMQKNAIAVLMCSRGTPMILAGDEFGNSQFGNNNAYCQDNEISWLDWSLLDKNRDLFEFFKYMIHFRKMHPILRKRTAPARSRFPEHSLHSIEPWDANYREDTRMIGVTFAGRNRSNTEDDIIYIGINAHWEEHIIRLPELPGQMQWYLAVDTNSGHPGDCYEPEDMPKIYNGVFHMQPRSVIIAQAKLL